MVIADSIRYGLTFLSPREQNQGSPETMASPPAPPTMTSRLAEAQTELRRLMQQPASEWTAEISKRAVRVYSQSVPGNQWKRFRVTLTFRGDSTYAFEELTNYPRRMQWDQNIASEATLATFADGVRLVTFSTPQALAGIVKPRRFVDCMCQSAPAKDTLLSLCISWDADDAAHEALLADGKVRGHNFPGGGLVLRRVDDESEPPTWRLVMIGFTDLGGGLPARIANRASPGAFFELFDGLAKKIEAKGGCRVPDDESFSVHF